MWVLSFPSGTLAVAIHNYISPGFSGRTGCVVAWLMIFLAGYAQWFILIPAILARFKKHADSPVGHASQSDR
jgi:hypothetical protein